MIPKLPNDVEELVEGEPTGVVQVAGSRGNYFVFTEEAMRIRQYVQEGIQEADGGKTTPWNTAEIIAKAQKIKEQRSV